jgi:hypothetical protein
MIQGDRLSMVALGNAAATAVLDVGVHLRWAMPTGVGFPAHGFRLYRRRHVAGSTPALDLTTIVFSGTTSFTSKDGGLRFSSTAGLRVDASWGSPPQPVVVAQPGTITITRTAALRELRITTVSTSAPKLAVYDGDLPLSVTPLTTTSGPTTSWLVAADRFDRVVVTCGAVADLYDVHATPCTESIASGWTQIATLALPPDAATATARLPSAWTSRYSPDDVSHLMEVVGLVGGGAKAYASDPPSTPPSQFVVHPQSLLLLAAIDPGVARMLGLYYMDPPAAAGASNGPLPNTAYDYKVEGYWTGTATPDDLWICWGVLLGTPPAVPVATGLAVTGRSVGAGLVGGGAGQTLAALTWTLPRGDSGGLAPGAPVAWHVARSTQQPDGSWGAGVALNPDAPVVIAAASALPPAYFLDGPLAPGAYRWNVRGVDLFGRTGAASAWAGATFVDTIAPPPPTDAAAKLSGTSGSYHAAVTWRWPDARRAQAPDASEFRVYCRTTDLRPASGHIASVTDDHDGTATVATDLDPSADWSRFVGGALVVRGARFTVLSVTAGSSLALKVQDATDDAGSPVLPPSPVSTSARAYLRYTTPALASSRFTLVVDWSDPARWPASVKSVPVGAASDYACPIPVAGLAPLAGEAVGYALVGVGAVDAAGNVGPVGPPVLLATPLSATVATPSAPAGATAWATRADCFGVSRYTLSIATTSGLRYDVLRALDATLSATASSLSDADLAALGDASDAAFTIVAGVDGTGAPVSSTDLLPGAGSNRYLYRVRAIDAAGNRSTPSPSLVVHLHDVVPPAAPARPSLRAGNRRIQVSWAKSAEADLALYRVYRTADAAKASDVRTMDLVATVASDGAASSSATATAKDDGAGHLTWTDASTAGFVDYRYRLVAVDASGNASPASSAAVGRAYDDTPPHPPTWVSAAWNSAETAVDLSWTLADATQTPRVQRAVDGTSDWYAISDWLAAGTTSLEDTTASTSRAYRYRLQVRGANTLTNRKYATTDPVVAS